MDGSAGKPVVWENDVPLAYLGLDFGVAPWAVPTGLSMVELVPYTSGYVLPTTASGLPQPAIWAATVMQILSTADPANPVGAGEAVATYTDQAYVAGETFGTDLVNRGRSLSVPALWTNGTRSDLGTLAAPAISPPVLEPLFGWWRLPGTPADAAPGLALPGRHGAGLGERLDLRGGVGRGPGDRGRAAGLGRASPGHFTQTVFTFTKARMPSSPSSRP